MASVIKRLAVLAGMAALLLIPATANAGTVPSGFQEKAVIEGLHEPTTLAFAPDGRVFVAEKSGVIQVFKSISDTKPEVLVDLSREVDNYWDRGLLGMALDPEFPAKPYLYVLYTLDAKPGGSVPAWGGTEPSDACPNPPGGTAQGCVVTGRLSKLTVSGNRVTAETPLITDWCQQFPSHSIGDLAFGADGDLYVSGGEGASFLYADWGQTGNPCGDPPGGVGGSMTPPTAEGGSLRSQDVRTPGDPTGLDGSLLRINPETGQGVPGNPFESSSDANARRILAYGLRNPFRFTIRPGTSEPWVGDVGNSTWEEIDRVDSTSTHADNFGWPCYEGDNVSSARAFEWDSANLNLCESLYNEGPAAVNAPYYSYNHSAKVVPGESCGVGSSSISGLTFYESGPFPNAYNGALFFADYSRGCIWAMMPGANGKPDPTNIKTFDAGAAEPVNLVVGPEGSLYFPDIGYSDTKGKIWRISYAAGDQPPVAAATATPSTGAAPLSVQLSAAGSSDPDPGDTLSYSWDLNGDGNFGDSTAVAPTHVYTEPGVHVATVRVSDPDGASDTASVSIHVNNTAPTATITSPSSSLTWAVGDQIAFSGTATDPEDGVLPASAYQWNVILHHCPSNCHLHQIETISGVKSGVFEAPDHEYPSWLEIKLTVTDSGGLTATRSVEEILPKTVTISTQTLPVSGFGIAVDGVSTVSPASTTVIKGSNNTISAPAQTVGGKSYEFGAWSDGGAATHNVTADQNLSLTAVMGPPGAPAISSLNPASPANNNSPVVKGTVGADFPATVKLFANSTCSGSPAVTVTPAQFTGTGVTVPVPDNTTTAISAATTNAAGNSTCSNSVTYTEDSSAPAAPTITGTSPPSPANDNNPEVKGSAEAGATVRLFKTSNCSGTAAATGSAAEFAAGLTVAVAGDTTTSLTAQATDAAGNVSPCSAATAYTEDSIVPAAPTITASSPASPANDNNPEVSGTVGTGSPVSVKVFLSANCNGTAVAAPVATFTGAGVTVAVPGDQVSSLTARAVDAAGNESPCSSSFSYTEDSKAPSAPTISSSTPVSPANANSPKFAGSAESGSTVRLFKSASCSGTAAATGSSSEFAAGLTVSVADDSANQITATATDAAGNVSPCSTAFTYTEDSTGPAAPTITATSPASPANDNSPEVSGSVGTGSPVSVKVFVAANCSGTAVSATVAAFTGVGVTVTVPGDQTSALSARAIDAAGNESSCSGAFSYVEDSKVPPAPAITASIPASPANSASPKLSGSAEAGSTVLLFKSASCSGATAATGTAAEFAAGLTVAVAADTTTQLTASVTDGAGNESACSTAFSYTEDSTAPGAPTITATSPPSPANDNSPEVSGSAAAESTVRIYESSNCSGQAAATGGASAFAGGLTVTVTGDSTTPLTATATDAAGNVSGCSAPLSYTEDSTGPAAPAITATSPVSPANSDQPRVSGTVGAGSPVSVEVFPGAGCTGAPVSGSAAIFIDPGIAIIVPDNQTSLLSTRAVDAAGNESACSVSFSYVEDSTLPEMPVIEATTPASPANDENPAVTGSAPAGSTVRIYETADCSGPEAATGSALELAAGLRLTTPVAANSTTQLSASATDAAENVSPCSQPFAYTEDSTAPAAPALGTTSPASPANDNDPTVSGGAESGATVRLYESADCSGPVAASGSAAELGAGLTVTVGDDTTTAISATATDAAANVSACSAPLSYTEDSTGPAAPKIDSSAPASPANFNNPRLSGEADGGSTVLVYESPGCTGPVAATGSAAEFAAGLMLPVADDSETSFSADAADPAGNLSACSSPLRYTEDSTAPQTSITRAPAARAVAFGRRGSRRAKTVRASFDFGSDDDTAHFLCEVDGAPFAPCSSPLVRGKLKLGSHRFEVYAVDPAGNADPTPASRRFRLVPPLRRAR